MSSEAPDAPEASTNGHEEGTEQVMPAESVQPEGESADAGEASEVLPEVSIAADPDDSGGAGTAEHEDGEDGGPLPGGGGGGGEGEGEPNFLPPFANETNRKLNRHIQLLDKQLEQTDGQLEESKDRISVMAEHLSNVQQELKFTQLRLEAKTKEISSEEHLKALSQREAGRIRSDLEKLAKERLELQDRMHGLQNQIFRTSEKMDGFKLLMNWNQEELEQWAVAQRQKEEDNLALEKYRRADDARIKELTMHVEKATQEVARAQEQVDLEVTETQASQVQLDRTAAEFKQLHGERQHLIQQWDEAMDALRHRDRAIEKAVEAFAGNKAALADKQDALDSQAKFLDNEVQSNKDLDSRIALVDREVAKLRGTQSREVKRAEETADELELVRNELSKAANELAAAGVQNGHSRQALDKKLLRLDAARKKHAALKRRLESEFGQLDTLEEKVKELEGMRTAAERHLADAVKEVAVQKKEQYKSGQTLFHSRERERELISEIAGGQAQARNLNHRIRYLDDQVVVQQELVYNVDFQLQQMERKVARARGERSDEETRALTALIDKLTKQLEGVNAEHQMLLNQVKKSEDDLSHAHRKNSALKRDTGKLSETMSTLSLESDMVSRSVRSAVEQKEGQMVQHDCLKLEVKRLRQLLNTRADEVFSLENKKQQLQLSIQERQHEIQAHAQALKAELKIIRDDLHRVTLELKERQLKVHSLQSKHEVLSSRNKSVYAEDEAQQSQAYYIIKSAQEREELQQRGDRLDGLIRKAEKEVHALEQTLIKLTGQNTDFSKSFRRADQKDAYQQRVQLREELDRAYDRLKFKRQEERNITTDIDNLAGRLQQLEMEGESLEGLVGELERKRSEAIRLMEEQREKMGRAEAHLRRMQTELRARRGMPPGPALVPEATDGAPDAAALLPEEKEVCLAQLRDMSRTMLQELRVLALENPGANLIEAVEAAGLKMPPSNAGPGSTRSRDSRDSSRAGSVVSM